MSSFFGKKLRKNLLYNGGAENPYRHRAVAGQRANERANKINVLYALSFHGTVID
jgi:hypothetical protein